MVEANFSRGTESNQSEVLSQNRVVTRHQCGISALVPQTSFGGKISGDVSFLRLLQSLKFFQRSLSGHRKLSCTGNLYWCISEDEAENFYHAMRV